MPHCGHDAEAVTSFNGPPGWEHPCGPLRVLSSSMSIVSRGDHIRPGRYQLHSRFAKAINFANGEWLVSLVNEDVGAGPVNLVMRKLPEQPLLHGLQIDEDGGQAWMGGTRFDLAKVAAYAATNCDAHGLRGGFPNLLSDVPLDTFVVGAPALAQLVKFELGLSAVKRTRHDDKGEIPSSHASDHAVE